MPTRKDFRIDKCDDCIRITRTDVQGDLHTHVHSGKRYLDFCAAATALILQDYPSKTICREHSQTQNDVVILRLKKHRHY